MVSKSLRIFGCLPSCLVLFMVGCGGKNPPAAQNQNAAPPPTITLQSQSSTITVGSSTTLTWTTQNADSVMIEPGIGRVQVAGAITVTPDRNTTYTATATGPGGHANASSTVEVVDRPTVLLTADATAIPTGSSTTLRWSSSSVDTLVIDPIGPVSPSGAMEIAPQRSTTYKATGSGAGGFATASVVVTTGPPVQISFFEASFSHIFPGQSTRLAWQAWNADRVEIEAVGSFGASGKIVVTPKESTTYVARAFGPGGSARAETQVSFLHKGPPQTNNLYLNVFYPCGIECVHSGGETNLSMYNFEASSAELTSIGWIGGIGDLTIDRTGTFAFHHCLTTFLDEGFYFHTLYLDPETGVYHFSPASLDGVVLSHPVSSPIADRVYGGIWNTNGTGLNLIAAYRYDNLGFLTPVPGSPFPLPTAASLQRLVVDPNGEFLYAISDAIHAFRFQRDGSLVAVASVDSVGSSIAIDRTGNFLFQVDDAQEQIRVFTVDRPTGALIKLSDSGAPSGHAGLFMMDGSNRFLYSATERQIRVYKFDERSGKLTAMAESPFLDSIQNFVLDNKAPLIFVATKTDFGAAVRGYRLNEMTGALEDTESRELRFDNPPELLDPNVVVESMVVLDAGTE